MRDMFTAAEKRFLARIAKSRSVSEKAIVEELAADDGVRDGRLVRVQLPEFAGDELDVSGLDALETLLVKGSLRRITLGELPRLTTLDLTDAKLERIDVSGCAALTRVEVARCGLEVLDLSALTRLEVLWCQDNRAHLTLPRTTTLR